MVTVLMTKTVQIELRSGRVLDPAPMLPPPTSVSVSELVPPVLLHGALTTPLALMDTATHAEGSGTAAGSQGSGSAEPSAGSMVTGMLGLSARGYTRSLSGSTCTVCGLGVAFTGCTECVQGVSWGIWGILGCSGGIFW